MPLDDQLKIFTGNRHPELAKSVCDYLQIPLGLSEVSKFSNENTFVQYHENIRRQNVFIIQPCSPNVNDSIMELLIMIDAAKRASAGTITAVIPYYAYGRTDKKDQPRVPITARLIADLLTVAGADRLLTMDLHAGQIQGFFNIPVDELTALPLQAKYLKSKSFDYPVVVAVDVGISKRARDLASRLGAPLAIVEKRRTGNHDGSEALNVIGDVAGLTAIMFDDETDTAGSLISAAEAVMQAGAREVYACSTHGIFSGKANDRILNSSIVEMIVTDTVPQAETTGLEKVSVITIAPLFGEAINRIYTGQSVGAMFDG